MQLSADFDDLGGSLELLAAHLETLEEEATRSKEIMEKDDQAPQAQAGQLRR